MVRDSNTDNLSVDSVLAGPYVAVPSTILKLGRSRESRTPTSSFGDCGATITLAACRKFAYGHAPSGSRVFQARGGFEPRIGLWDVWLAVSQPFGLTLPE